MRLNKYLSSTGICSRREADSWIEAGRVTINGRLPELGTQVGAGDEVCVDGKPVGQRQQKHVYIALNKPPGITCTTERHIKGNIVDFVGHRERIFPIGRLDKESDGLILLTSNGDIVNEILRSENNHEKEYRVVVDRPFPDSFLDDLQAGVFLKELEVKTKPCVADRISPRSFRIVLTQGLNRQIRRMCDHFGYKVQRLQRVRIINVRLGDLKSGAWRDLGPDELKGLLPGRTQW
jgi:23S rRNA pseudouridine2604 synthase